jgi:hypothetical protein
LVLGGYKPRKLKGQKGLPLTATEVAKMHVLSDEGVSKTEIAAALERSHFAVEATLKKTSYLADPMIQAKIKAMQDNELQDLTLIAVKARSRLHNLLDAEATGPIETTAILDKTFMQRRLLEGSSTSNVEIHSIDADAAALQARIEELERGKG